MPIRALEADMDRVVLEETMSASDDSEVGKRALSELLGTTTVDCSRSGRHA